MNGRYLIAATIKKSLSGPLGSDSDNQVSATLNERRTIVKMSKIYYVRSYGPILWDPE